MDYTYLEDGLPANVLAVLEDLDDHSWKIMMSFIDDLKSQVEEAETDVGYYESLYEEAECRVDELTQELEEN